MREIKFRALKDDISNCSFVYGYLVRDEEGNPYIVDYTSDKGYSHISCIKGTEAQFTGLKDKNGVDIYEGDILKHDRYKTTKDVEWVDGCGFECYIDDNDEFDNLIGYIPELLEVIGNIHQNK